MSFSSGTYSLPAGNPVVTGTTISSTTHNNTESDIASALSTAILKDGTQTCTAAIPFVTGVTTTSTTFAVFNTTATTINAFGGASVALNMGHASGTNTVLGATTFSQAMTLSSTVNKVTLTAPATSATLTIANTGSLITSGAYAITLTATAATNVTLPTSGTLATTAQLPPSPGQLTNSIGADVALNNVSNYFDGPSVAQGTTGTWFASGTVSLSDSGGASTFFAQLWDGTTVIASAVSATAASQNNTISLSGYLASPAGNIRISVRDITRTTGLIVANSTSLTKDSTISVYRIA